MQVLQIPSITEVDASQELGHDPSEATPDDFCLPRGCPVGTTTFGQRHNFLRNLWNDPFKGIGMVGTSIAV